MLIDTGVRSLANFNNTVKKRKKKPKHREHDEVGLNRLVLLPGSRLI
jgi:hypothetical protein